MSKMQDPMTYEMSIRRIFSCYRYEHGANTDTYTGLCTNYLSYTAKKTGSNESGAMHIHKTLEEAAFDYGSSCGIVALHLRNAISHLADQLRDKAGYEDTTVELTGIENTLFDARFDAIDKAVERLDKILDDLKM